MSPVPADLLMMLLGDARLPVAGHTQSATLEPAVRDGLGVDEVPLYLAGRLHSVVRVEMGVAVVALHHLVHELAVEPVVRAWAARTPSPALRTASRPLRVCLTLVKPSSQSMVLSTCDRSWSGSANSTR